ncbi:MAG: hypothetical protein EAZ55_10645 [Cytophagales bacterium]|nr:MAG: hypothetical protein EAZ55_10645 [Cytophagales bacterium]
MIDAQKEENSFYAKDRQTWRDWLQENHETKKAVWLIIYRKNTNTSSVSYPEAVDEALCFGWIDSSVRKRDEESFYQFFSKRNPKSNWSKLNKEKIAYLTEQNLMTEAGKKAVAIAQKNGAWNALDEVEALILPLDLESAFRALPTTDALQNWEGFSRSARRGILEWLFNAKKEETRQRRIKLIVEAAQENEKLNP